MAEPFDWMEAKRNPEAARAQKAKAVAMVRAELEERAGLLHRLGHGKDAVRARLMANLRWDFDGREGPIKTAEVDAIVDRVYGNGAPGKPGPRPKGGTR
jgi:hypothetical protein